MTGARRRGRAAAAGRAIGRLLLCVFALRAVVPLGYMPDLGALGEGRFEIVVCTPSGIETLEVDAEGRPVAPDKGDGTVKSAADCPFGTAAAKALASPEALPASTAASYVGRFLVASGPAPTPPAQGPPLGPRAPPLLLG